MKSQTEIDNQKKQIESERVAFKGEIQKKNEEIQRDKDKLRAERSEFSNYMNQRRAEFELDMANKQEEFAQKQEIMRQSWKTEEAQYQEKIEKNQNKITILDDQILQLNADIKKKNEEISDIIVNIINKFEQIDRYWENTKDYWENAQSTIDSLCQKQLEILDEFVKSNKDADAMIKAHRGIGDAYSTIIYSYPELRERHIKGIIDALNAGSKHLKDWKPDVDAWNRIRDAFHEKERRVRAGEKDAIIYDIKKPKAD